MMLRRRAALLAGAVVACVSIYPASQAVAGEGAQDSILVWKLQPKSNMSQEEVDSLTDFVAAEVEKHSGRAVVSEADLQSVLKRERTRAECGLKISTECIAEIGAALGAGEIIQGNLGEVGGTWFFNIARIHVRRAETLKRISLTSKVSLKALVNQVPAAVAELYGVTLAPVAVEGTQPVDRVLPWVLTGISAAALGGGIALHAINAGMTSGDATPTFAGSVACYAVSAGLLTWAIVEFTRPAEAASVQGSVMSKAEGPAGSRIALAPVVAPSAVGLAGTW